MKNEKLYFISWIRAFSTICIVLCHLCSSSSIGWIIPFGQVFNIGVQIFFLYQLLLWVSRKYYKC